MVAVGSAYAEVHREYLAVTSTLMDLPDLGRPLLLVVRRADLAVGELLTAATASAGERPGGAADRDRLATMVLLVEGLTETLDASSGTPDSVASALERIHKVDRGQQASGDPA